MASQDSPAHDIARKILSALLDDFDVVQTGKGSEIVFQGDLPALKSTESEKLLLSLVGALPSAANALVAAQIFELRGGLPQNIKIDLRKGHNYIDPNIGMTPTINGQVTDSRWFNDEVQGSDSYKSR